MGKTVTVDWITKVKIQTNSQNSVQNKNTI